MRPINRQAGLGTTSGGGDNFAEFSPPVPKPSEQAMKRAIAAKEQEKQRKAKERKKARRAAAKKAGPIEKTKRKPNQPKPSISLAAELRAIFSGRSR